MFVERVDEAKLSDEALLVKATRRGDLSQLRSSDDEDGETVEGAMCTTPEAIRAAPRELPGERGARVCHVCDLDTQVTPSGRLVVKFQHWAVPSVLSPHEWNEPVVMAVNAPCGASV